MEKPDRMSRPDGFWVRGVYHLPDDYMPEEIAAGYRAVQEGIRQGVNEQLRWLMAQDAIMALAIQKQ